MHPLVERLNDALGFYSPAMVFEILYDMDHLGLLPENVDLEELAIQQPSMSWEEFAATIRDWGLGD